MLGTSQMGSRAYAVTSDHHIRAAGVTTNFNETTQACMTWEDRPSTPVDIQKYRQSTVHEPGQTVRHWGVAADPVPKGTFGVKSVSLEGENVASYLKCYPETDLGQWLNDRKEHIYASAQGEPLGRSCNRGHRIPGGLGTARPFGILSGAQEKEAACLARQITFPDEDPENEETPQAHELYVRSHGAYAPGEQRTRGYDWKKTGVDPARYTFGAVDKEDYRDGVKKALNAEDPSVAGPPKIIDKKVDDLLTTCTDVLGKPKIVRHGDRRFPEDMTFGNPSIKFQEDGVDKLITGYYSLEEQQPDVDLGLTLREGWRNVAPDDKVFGVPTVRLDIPAPPTRSVANMQNYGNDPDANQLIHPTGTAIRGVNEEHYLKGRTKEELRGLLLTSNVDLNDKEFEEIFRSSSERDGMKDRCCINTFMKTRFKNLAESMEL
ncbi:hypothetical protein BSKO_06158 [Bryopsis sp. KO-2023]|nr:hypothetical protein BSKO_06158 [Bryopsis sp. KO-2023]